MDGMYVLLVGEMAFTRRRVPFMRVAYVKYEEEIEQPQEGCILLPLSTLLGHLRKLRINGSWL